MKIHLFTYSHIHQITHNKYYHQGEEHMTYIVKRGLYGEWLYLCTPHRAKFQVLANGEVRDTDWQERRYRKY